MLVKHFTGWGATALKNAYFGPGTGPVLLNNINCRGNETRLSSCSFTRYSIVRCDHYQDVSVRCRTTCTEGDVILLNGTNGFHEGRVLVCKQGWKRVCNDSWDSNDAMVVCRQLGYITRGRRALYLMPGPSIDI